MLGQVSDNQPHTWEQLSCVPLDLGDHTLRRLSRFGLILKTVVNDLEFVGRPPYGSGEQQLNSTLQRGIGLDADGVTVAFLLQLTH